MYTHNVYILVYMHIVQDIYIYIYIHIYIYTHIHKLSKEDDVGGVLRHEERPALNNTSNDNNVYMYMYISVYVHI